MRGPADKLSGKDKCNKVNPVVKKPFPLYNYLCTCDLYSPVHNVLDGCITAYTLRGEVGGDWALEFPSFLGPVKWERADRRVPFHLHNVPIRYIKKLQ